jgi:hypothetical protein
LIVTGVSADPEINMKHSVTMQREADTGYVRAPSVAADHSLVTEATAPTGTTTTIVHAHKEPAITTVMAGVTLKTIVTTKETETTGMTETTTLAEDGILIMTNRAQEVTSTTTVAEVVNHAIEN